MSDGPYLILGYYQVAIEIYHIYKDRPPHSLLVGIYRSLIFSYLSKIIRMS